MIVESQQKHSSCVGGHKPLLIKLLEADAFDTCWVGPIVAQDCLERIMIQRTRQTDEIRGAGAIDCWCLHGAVGAAGDWRKFAASMSEQSIASRSVDLWRFLACEPMSLARFGEALNAEANDVGAGRARRVLVGYSMGGRLALQALVRADSPWDSAVIVSAHPGLEDADERRGQHDHAPIAALGALSEYGCPLTGRCESPPQVPVTRF